MDVFTENTHLVFNRFFMEYCIPWIFFCLLDDFKAVLTQSFRILVASILIRSWNLDFFAYVVVKVQLFWEDQKKLRNPPYGFEVY